jgi:hypothetical protein
MEAAVSPMERLRHACDYARAVAKAGGPAEADELAHAITRMADERNHP